MKTNKKAIGCFLAVFMLLAVSLASAVITSTSELREMKRKGIGMPSVASSKKQMGEV